MTADVKKVRVEEKEKYVIFQDKAKQFYEESNVAQKARRWAAVGLNAMHCAISMCDALTIYFLQKRSVADDHRLAVDLLSEMPAEGIENQLANYKRILAKKYVVAYEDREFRQNEALDIAKQVECFYQWGISKLPTK
jgi:hypothetical protein